MESMTVDIVASPDVLAEKLMMVTSKYWSPPRFPVTPVIDDNAVEKIIIQIRRQTGNDFAQYKRSTLQRRVERRMSIHQIMNISDYVRFIQENPAEAEILFKEMLIGVTSFFRDPDIWEQLGEKVIPAVLSQNPEKEVFRTWIPGCSTGEEAYSFAIMLKEAMENRRPKAHFSIQIFATDLDPQAIDFARKAEYALSIEASVAPHLLKKYFVKEGNSYRVRSEIRQMVVFAVHNVIKDPPFSKLDFLSCRNMLIYMQTPLQKNLMNLFHYSLLDKGILILGNSESINSLTDLFTPLESKSRIFERASFRRRSAELFDLPSSYFKTAYTDIMKQPEGINENLEVLTDRLLLDQLSPSGVLTNSHGDIVYVIGSTGNYLEPAVGKANLNIFSMAREGFRTILPSAIRKANRDFKKSVCHNIKVEINKTTQLIAMSIQQLESPLALKGKLLILFTNEPEKEKKIVRPKAGKNENTSKVSELEQALVEVGQELQNTTEEMQTSQEELRSTNEELTTSKEEMQSLNEELQTTNIELQSKIDDTIRISSDMNNLLNSGEIATLFLDKRLNIRHFTPAATKIFKLITTDVGRPFTDLAMNLNYPSLLADAIEVLRTLIFTEKPIKNTNNRWFKVRIMPYRTLDDRIDGVVITFIDITISKQLEYKLADAQRLISFYSNNVSKGVIRLSQQWEIKELNTEVEDYFKITRKDVLGKDFFDAFCEKSVRVKTKAALNKSISDAESNSVTSFDVISSIDHQNVSWNAIKINSEADVFTGIVLTAEKKPT